MVPMPIHGGIGGFVVQIDTKGLLSLLFPVLDFTVVYNPPARSLA